MQKKRPVGTYFNSITDQFIPSDDLSIEQQNEDLMNSMGLFPDLGADRFEQERLAKKKILDEQDAAIDKEFNEEDELRKLDASAPEIVRDPFQPPQIPEQQQVQQQPEFDLNSMISEYAKAAKDVTKRKDDLAAAKALTTIFQGGLQTASQQDIKSNADLVFKDLMDNADAPLFELEARDKGRALQQRMSLSDMELALQKESQSRDSDLSRIAREQYANSFMSIGQPELSEKIRSGKLSLQELKSMFGSLNLANMEAIYTSQQAKLEQAQMKSLAKQEEQAAELEKEKKKMITSLRKELNSGEVGKAYSTAINMQNRVNSINEFLKKPDGYSDFGTLMLGLKSLQGDESVLREAEMRLGREATSFVNKVLNQYQSLKSGQSLQPEQRKQIARAANILATGYRASLRSRLNPIIEQAKAEGLPLNQIIGDKNILKELGELPAETEQQPKQDSNNNNEGSNKKPSWIKQDGPTSKPKWAR